MTNTDTVQNALNKLAPLFQVTDDVLNEWTGEGNLQFPVLLGMLAVKLNWDERQVREHDPMVRFYIRNNPNWFVTRGAKGGIMRATDKEKKAVAKSAKDQTKADVAALIEAEVNSE
jgi:hypothetical protein